MLRSCNHDGCVVIYDSVYTSCTICAISQNLKYILSKIGKLNSLLKEEHIKISTETISLEIADDLRTTMDGLLK